MLILVTGATGFIGERLIDELLNRGYDVHALARDVSKLPPKVRGIPWSFGQKLTEEQLRNADALFHLAHDFRGEEGAGRTMAGTLELFREGVQAKVRRQVLISSYSASPDAVSIYGRCKYALEQEFIKQNGLVVRPGLVLGDGGIFGRIKKVAQHWPVIPLPDGGRGRLTVIDIDILAKRLADLVTVANPPPDANLFEPKEIRLRDLVLRTARQVDRRPWILPVPSVLVMTGLGLAEALRLRLPVNPDNLRGFLANQNTIHVSSLGSNLEYLL